MTVIEVAGAHESYRRGKGLRNTGAALGVAFVWLAVVENVVRVVRPAWQEWLLTDNAAALVLRGDSTASSSTGPAWTRTAA